jgi:protocatechuate 3,4-dioxygenase beta subunit
MKKIYFFLLSALIINYACNQNRSTAQTATSQQGKPVGEGCDGCELIYVGMPAKISSIDTSPAWNEKGQKLLAQGTVYKPDGKTLAPGIILYYHQTNNDGLYLPSPKQDERSKRHGHIRGWVKSDTNGKYAVYTIQPAAYPGRTLPAHIHLTIKEPGINEYYIDDINFDNDPILAAEMRKRMEKRGGPGIVQVTKDKTGLLVCTRDIILGKNIPNYR